MGLDCPNVRTVIHLSSLTDIEEYLQETGRAGRDGNYSRAVLYCSKKNFAFPTSDHAMKQYCVNKDKCKRQLLLQEFESFECDDTTDSVTTSSHCTCTCCDICEMTCSCDLCM